MDTKSELPESCYCETKDCKTWKNSRTNEYERLTDVASNSEEHVNNNRIKGNIGHEVSSVGTKELNQNYLNKRPSKSFHIIERVPDATEVTKKDFVTSNKSEKLGSSMERSEANMNPRLSYKISPSNTQLRSVPKNKNVTDEPSSVIIQTECNGKDISQRLEMPPSDCISKGSSNLQIPIKCKFFTVSNNLTNGNKEASKDLFARLALVKIWVILILTSLFFILLMIASHLTSSLTLRMEAYHALYNVLALGGYLLAMKICQQPQSLKNTFGWARLEVLSCLCTLLFMAALCFSVTLESIQIVAHAGHQEALHHPLPIIALSGAGLCFNAFVFCLIGGFTHHQTCFLERRDSDVCVKKNALEEAVQAGQKTLSSSAFREMAEFPLPRSYQGIRGILRDVAGLVSTMFCAVIVYLMDEDDPVTLIIDPVFALLSISVLLVLSYPYGKECCQILLQTIPGSINVETFSEKLFQKIPKLINIHHLHIWSLTPGKIMVTAHVVYSSPDAYRKSCQDLEQFFVQKNITHVTLQPEFLNTSHKDKDVNKNIGCLLTCSTNLCREKECCQWRSKPESIETNNHDKNGVSSNGQIIQRTKASEIESSICMNHH